MNLDLSGKNALVCGSSKGIGWATAQKLAVLGANVTLVSRSAEIMSDLVSQLAKQPGQDHDFLMADFSQRADLRRKIVGLTSHKTIHILINNTGGPKGGPILDAELEEFEQAFNNHVLCSHLLVKACVPGMKKEGYGRIINIISTSVKQPIPGLGVSNTIRGAMGNWSKTLAGEVGPFGITVNNLLPGFTATDRLEEIIQSRADKQGVSADQVREVMRQSVPVGRIGEPGEIGRVIAFLASPAASYINGTNIVVDGGRTGSL